MSEHDHVGKASFGSDKPKRNWDNANWKITKDSKHIYRVLPPFASLASAGRWFQYEAVIWGFTGTNGKQKPFRSILWKNKKGMIERPDPALAWIDRMHKELDDKMKEMKEAGKSKAEIEKKLEPLMAKCNQYRIDKFFNLNVMRQDGTMGRLKLKIKHKQVLETLFSRLMSEDGVNPIDPEEGVWVDFRKVGEGRDTQFTCEPVYEVTKENGRVVKSLKMAPLADADLARMKTEAFDLTMAYRNLSEEEVGRLAESEGDPNVVDSVFGVKVETSHSGPLPKVDFDDVNKDADEVSPEQVMASLQPKKQEKAKLLSKFDNDDLNF